MTNWLATRGKPYAMDLNFRQQVAMNIDHIVRRAETMACKLEREQVCYTTLGTYRPRFADSSTAGRHAEHAGRAGGEDGGQFALAGDEPDQPREDDGDIPAVVLRRACRLLFLLSAVFASSCCLVITGSCIHTCTLHVFAKRIVPCISVRGRGSPRSA